MIRALKEIWTGFVSLLTGMKITIGQAFKPTVTLHYPHEALKMPARFRGHIELVLDPKTGKPICYACKLCERSCPSECITVDGAKLEGAKKKSVTQYNLDFTKCSLCGSCVEACRDGAIRFSHAYNLASTNKDDFVIDLFKKLEREAAEAGIVPQSAPAPAAVPAPTPAVAATAPAAPAAPAAVTTSAPAPQPPTAPSAQSTEAK